MDTPEDEHDTSLSVSRNSPESTNSVSYEQSEIDRTIKASLLKIDGETPNAQLSTTFLQTYEILNRALWAGKLPANVMFVVNCRRGVAGHYVPDRWSSSDGQTAHEIAFDGNRLRQNDGLHFLGVFAHECTHLWQYIYGTPGKYGYHNKEFAVEARRVGLETIDLSGDGGKDTGVRVSAKIIERGALDQLYQRMVAAGFEVTWAQALLNTSSIDPQQESLRKKKRASKTRYSCVTCSLNAWAKPNVKLICGSCATKMKEELS